MSYLYVLKTQDIWAANFFSANMTDATDATDDGEEYEEDYEEDYEDDYGEDNASVNGEDYSNLDYGNEENTTNGTNGTDPQAGALRSTYV